MIVTGSVKGSPGASCLAAGLASCLHGGINRTAAAATHGKSTSGGRVAVLIEADPAGGVAAIRAELSGGVGMSSLAARTRGSAVSSRSLQEHLGALPSGTQVLAGPVAADQAASAVEVLANPLAEFAQAEGLASCLVVDVGRMDPDTAAAPLIHAADGVVVVASADVEGVAGAAAWMAAIRSAASEGASPAAELAKRVAIVMREPAYGREYSAREVAETVEAMVVGRLPHDVRAAVSAFTGPPGRGEWWTAVSRIAEQIRAVPHRR